MVDQSNGVHAGLQARTPDALGTGFSAQQLAAIVDSSDDAIIRKDLDGTIKSWNTGAERMFGYRRGEVIGKSIRITTDHDGDRQEDAVLRRLRWAGRIDHFETTGCAKGGRLIPIALTAWPVFDQSGNVTGTCMIARDKHAELIAKRAEGQAAFLAQSAGALTQSHEVGETLKALASLAVPHLADLCAIDLVKSEHEIVRLAAVHVDPTKIELANLVHRHEDPNAAYSPALVIRTARPALLPTITDDIIREAANGDAERIELIKSLGVVSYICVPMIAHGRTFGSVTLATAESGRRYSDDDLRFAEDVAARAAVAIESAQAYDQLNIANRLKDEFLATLSHELRTPLNAVLGYARMLRVGDMSSERVSHALEVIERNATALTRIVEDVLDVSLIVSGKVRLKVRPVDLAQVILDACETIAPAADAKRIRIETMVNSTVGPVSGDPDRLQQVVWNLLSNAVKFTPREGSVQVRLERVAAHVEIVVTDTGVGIPPDFLPHMFERFRQANASTTRRRGGLGLGLAIARHIVEMHGGSIHAVSGGEGKGATFRVSLPAMGGHEERHSQDESTDGPR